MVWYGTVVSIGSLTRLGFKCLIFRAQHASPGDKLHILIGWYVYFT